MKRRFVAFLKDEEGQDLVEYTLLLAFVTLSSAAVFSGVGGNIKQVWIQANVQLASAVAAAS